MKEPERLYEWDMNDELIHIITSADRAQKKLHEHKIEHAILETKIMHLEAEINRRGQALEKYGDHTEDCEWIEAQSTGRLLEGKEKDLCSCGFSELLVELKTLAPLA